MTNKAGPRKAAYDKAYNARPSEVRRRVKRNAARRAMLRAGKVKKGQDVDHKNPLSDGGSNAKSNLRATSKRTNRGWRKGKSGYNP